MAENESGGEVVREAVRQAYGQIARQHIEEANSDTRPRASCCTPAQQSSCCGPSQQATAPATGAQRFYSQEELDSLPESVAGASLGCGNPLALADLQPGETVLDLGSGGGIDCFLAARQVGPAGTVIGLDMTPEMVKLARRNARKLGVTNVEFQWGEMEELPFPDESVDVVISNCVINLSPDKDAVFQEAYRVLRPGGRLSVSDIVVDGDLPPAVRRSLDAWAGCVAGALDESIYLSKMRDAGFEEVEVLSRDVAADELVEGDELQVLLARPDGQVVSGEEAHTLLDQAGLSVAEIARKVASVKVRARKPAGR